jgi:hypothetical protein
LSLAKEYVTKYLPLPRPRLILPATSGLPSSPRPRNQFPTTVA